MVWIFHGELLNNQIVAIENPGFLNMSILWKWAMIHRYVQFPAVFLWLGNSFRLFFVNVGFCSKACFIARGRASKHDNIGQQISWRAAFLWKYLDIYIYIYIHIYHVIMLYIYTSTNSVTV